MALNRFQMYGEPSKVTCSPFKKLLEEQEFRQMHFMVGKQKNLNFLYKIHKFCMNFFFSFSDQKILLARFLSINGFSKGMSILLWEVCRTFESDLIPYCGFFDLSVKSRFLVKIC